MMQTADENQESLAAYPRLLLDDLSASEPPLPAVFHESFPSHFVGRRSSGVWPDHSDNPAAVAAYREGYSALHTQKDIVAAIRAYEEALEHDPMYFRAWVDLGIACVMDNTAESLDRAEGIFAYLCGIEPDGVWLTQEVASILHQNLGYLRLVRYRRTRDRAYLGLADAEYQRADGLAEQQRIELLCPWVFVKLELGEKESAQALWDRATHAAKADRGILAEYAAKYAPLRTFLGERG